MSDEDPKSEPKLVDITVEYPETSIVPVSHESAALGRPIDIVSSARAATVSYKLSLFPSNNIGDGHAQGIWDKGEEIELAQVITSVKVTPELINLRYDQGEHVLVQQELAKIDGLLKDQNFSRIGLNNMVIHAEWNMGYVNLTILMDREGNARVEYGLELANTLAEGLEHIMTRSAMEEYRAQATILSNQAIGEKPMGPLSLE